MAFERRREHVQPHEAGEGVGWKVLLPQYLGLMARLAAFGARS